MVKLEFLIIITFSFLSILPVLSGIKNGRAETLSQLVKDVIENERMPSCLSAKTCWSRYEDFKFFKSISIPVQVLEPTASFNLPVNENTNKQWFFIDMKCERNSEILSNVDNKYFAHPYRWIIADATHRTMQNLTLLPDSNVMIADQDPHLERYNLRQGM